jgi:hypothetical protein
MLLLRVSILNGMKRGQNLRTLHCKKAMLEFFRFRRRQMMQQDNLLYQGVGDFLPHGRLVRHIRCLRRNLKNVDIAFLAV